ncbi:class I SAM-dependent methyltransferase [Nocardiopsis alborubida]|uniref:Class I SAM-dependent methyltransferase n=1 Tax=Nocardiopsis alborubida TaxID=146802 RepID=A0A7X6MHC1_9ACTN|nr:class I SAM-dependent methyltransferase [Nocardiopsis alborubida]NKZ01353.1 class I SAM-dependent methyltransferase [Nocardiopsis alborubida]
MSPTPTCRICSSSLHEFLDLGSQPLSDRFRLPHDDGPEYTYRLAVAACDKCTMVQLVNEVPRDLMFHADYPYLSSGSSKMRRHFTEFADGLASSDPDLFVVELGCNDGVMLSSLAAKGIRHLGVEPSAGVAALAERAGAQVWNAFFEESTARRILHEHGAADVVYAANTLCHIPYIGSILRGVSALLSPHGRFVFEDPYFADIVRLGSFDQVYDEHFYFFTARSVREMARKYGLELVDVERLTVHGGEVRYTLALAGAREPSPAVAELISEEEQTELVAPATLARFAARVRATRDDLVGLLRELRGQGASIAGYGATAKSATVLNYCGIGPELVSYISDTTPDKQGRVTPGTRIPVRPSADFSRPYPDYAVLFAWNHKEEIMAKEEGFRRAGGRWIHYVPDVRVE